MLTVLTALLSAPGAVAARGHVALTTCPALNQAELNRQELDDWKNPFSLITEDAAHLECGCGDQQRELVTLAKQNTAKKEAIDRINSIVTDICKRLESIAEGRTGVHNETCFNDRPVDGLLRIITVNISNFLETALSAIVAPEHKEKLKHVFLQRLAMLRNEITEWRNLEWGGEARQIFNYATFETPSNLNLPIDYCANPKRREKWDLRPPEVFCSYFNRKYEYSKLSEHELEREAIRKRNLADKCINDRAAKHTEVRADALTSDEQVVRSLDCPGLIDRLRSRKSLEEFQKPYVMDAIARCSEEMMVKVNPVYESIKVGNQKFPKFGDEKPARRDNSIAVTTLASEGPEADTANTTSASKKPAADTANTTLVSEGPEVVTANTTLVSEKPEVVTANAQNVTAEASDNQDCESIYNLLRSIASAEAFDDDDAKKGIESCGQNYESRFAKLLSDINAGKVEPVTNVTDSVGEAVIPELVNTTDSKTTTNTTELLQELIDDVQEIKITLDERANKTNCEDLVSAAAEKKVVDEIKLIQEKADHCDESVKQKINARLEQVNRLAICAMLSNESSGLKGDALASKLEEMKASGCDQPSIPSGSGLLSTYGMPLAVGVTGLTAAVAGYNYKDKIMDAVSSMRGKPSTASVTQVKKDSSKGAIAGIVFGVLALVGLAVWAVYRYRQRQNDY